MTFGSLFTGIGGMDLGLERAGMECKWQVEINPYATKVLERHWPTVKRYEDIKVVGQLEYVELIAGGFPCQDISFAGFGAGLAGERSGLWFEFARIIRMVRPRFVVVENVSALLHRGLGDVLGTLSDLGFDAEWSTVSACALGSTHMRRRLFIVAHANSVNGWTWLRNSNARPGRPVSQVDSFASSRARAQARMANPSELYGGANGISAGLDRNHGIGNAVYPDVAEWIGRRIMEASYSCKTCEVGRLPVPNGLCPEPATMKPTCPKCGATDRLTFGSERRAFTRWLCNACCQHFEVPNCPKCGTCWDGYKPMLNGLCPVVGCEFSLPVPYSLDAPPFDSKELSE